MSDSITALPGCSRPQTQLATGYARRTPGTTQASDEYYLYRGVSFIDALNDAEPELILGLVRALDHGHFEFVGSSLLCLMDEYDSVCGKEAFEQIVGHFK